MSENNLKFTNGFDQRETYELVENITSGRFKSEIELLKSLVMQIVDHDDFEITGGRVWRFIPDENVYELVYQAGNVKRIPKGYKVSVVDQPIFDELPKRRAILNYETDELLRTKGIKLYSVTGVGDIVNTKHGEYYRYALGFNAPAILQHFFDTLTIISSVTTIALNNLSTRAEHMRLREDIIQASEIQRNLLPDSYMEFSDYKVHGVCIPIHSVGGDYFDYFRNNSEEEERIGIVISDACSHGLPAAIQALFVSGAIRMAMAVSTKITRWIKRLNTLLIETFPDYRFVTLFYCELTTSKNRLVLYSNAGHTEPIHYRASMDKISYLESTGGFLGVIENQKFHMEDFHMYPGDVLVMYTDGISEAHDKKGNLYGVARIAELVRKYHKESPKFISDMILEDVQRHSAGSDIIDDKTLIVVRRDDATPGTV
ncbi:MAG: PP2C family protein-serine/threonine phosphatase [Candidatus Kapaibacterium sp.]